MFEDFTHSALIDAMVEATRDESAAIARRFALIGQLDARRAQELAERNWWRTDPYEEVVAEIAAAQNISRGAGLQATFSLRGSCVIDCGGGGGVRHRGDRHADGVDHHRAYRERR
jgi:hypothetical protein